MKNLVRTGLLFLVVIVTLSMVITIPAVLQEEGLERDLEAESEAMTEINRWRIRRGLSPMARNADLDFLAMQQAEYMYDQIPFSNVVDFHTDQFGDSPADRARLAGWPGYDFNTFAAEIAAYYPSVDGAINFWQSSPVHTATAMNPGYREMGLVVLRNGNWKLFYVVVAGRPGVLPVMYDPQRRTLFLSTDQSGFENFEFQPSRLRILDEGGNILHEDPWLVWDNRIRLPDDATDRITIIMTDGVLEYATEVDLYDSRAFPSEPTPVPTFTPAATATRDPRVSTATPLPPTLTPSATPEPLRDDYDVVLVYNTDVLTLRNKSGEDLNLQPLVFVSSEINAAYTATFMGAYFEGSLQSFPDDYCMQMWSFALGLSEPPLPRTCDLLASGRSILRPGDRFWVAGSFDIYFNTELIASCESSLGRCEFDVPRIPTLDDLDSDEE